MSTPRVKPFREYAKYYDLIYRDKNYEGESDFVERVLQSFSPTPSRTILDVGCGTGQHSLLLARRGYALAGIDASEVAIEIAREKARRYQLQMDFFQADMRTFDLHRTFDACISMFAVMDYLTRNEDIQAALTSIRKHLKRDSLFVFDCWNGLAVLRILPSVTVKTVEDGNLSLIRVAQPHLNAFEHLCSVDYHMLATRDDKIIDEIRETHVVRFFFPQEISKYLHDADFEVLKICPFPELGGTVDETVWNICVICKAGRL